jgi:hypothetical protein
MTRGFALAGSCGRGFRGVDPSGQHGDVRSGGRLP